MELTILGCSPSFPNPGIPSSSYMATADDTHLLLDCGHGASAALLAAFDPTVLTGIVISHMHPDHFFDLVPLCYAAQYFHWPKIPLLLPPGGEQRLRDLQRAVGLADDFFRQTWTVDEYPSNGTIGIGALEATFHPTVHFIDAYAARLRVRDRADSFVFGSDTGPNASLTDFVKGSRTALVEATLLPEAPKDEQHGHLTGEAAGRLACEAGLERLILTHYPSVHGEELLRQARKHFKGAVHLAQVGECYTL